MFVIEEAQAFAVEHGLSAETTIALCNLCSRLISRAVAEINQEDAGHTFATRDQEPSVTPSVLADAHESTPSFNTNFTDANALDVEPRYKDLGVLGVGGMGVVHRVLERSIGRHLAMKILKPDLLTKPRSVARFIEEAQIVGQLQHPGLVPIHELGQLRDGRPYFTMREVKGREFGAVIAEVHEASSQGDWQVAPSGWTFSKLLNAFLWICETVAYAHSKGVIHRDLKPSNILIGSNDEILVVDWGIAKVLGRSQTNNTEPDDIVVTDRSRNAALATQEGSITGTPAYMPPEQAFGQAADIDARFDVYALGAIFYQILSGRPPYRGSSAAAILLSIGQGPPASLADISTRPLPSDLLAVCERAMHRDPSLRYASAKDLANALTSWLDSTKRRDKALQLVHHAADLEHAASLTSRRAAQLRRQGEALLATIPPHAPETDKHPGWAKEDEANQLLQQADLQDLEASQCLHAALTEVHDLAEAHALLARRYLAQHRAAEVLQQRAAASRAEVLLRTHVDALPPQSPERQRFTSYLRGVGALTLWTDPPGAEVQLFRYAEKYRRLDPVFERVLGRTPLQEVALDPGSYLCVLQRPGFESVRYPVLIERQQHWDGVRPGDHDPFPIVLPPAGSLGSDEVYVPAGWFWAGGDPEASGAIPRRRLWADPFAIWRFPITNAQYMAFLDDLVAQGREAEALQFVPRERPGTQSELGAVIYGRDNEGRFVLRPDADGDLWSPDWPVVMIDWFGVAAYCAHFAAKTGQPWQLPSEWIREKAARGVDGRFFPWGNGFDPSWCCMRDSHATQSMPAALDNFPVDASPYGVRGLAGNARDWCADLWLKDGPNSAIIDFSNAPQRHSKADLYRSLRGGYWSIDSLGCRAASRYFGAPSFRFGGLGGRPARSIII